MGTNVEIQTANAMVLLEAGLFPENRPALSKQPNLPILLEETDCGLNGRLEYDTDLFEAITIKRFLQHFLLSPAANAMNSRRVITTHRQPS